MKDLDAKVVDAVNFLKKKKKRKLRSVSLADPKTSKRRVVKLKSKGQEILELIKKNLPGEDMYLGSTIENLLKIKGYEPGAGDAQFYSAILNNTFYNQKISITDILGNRKFKYGFCLSPRYANEYKCYTNDKLYWVSSIYNELKGKEIIDALVIDNAEFELATLSAVQRGDIKQGFIQDFDKELCVIATKEYAKDGLNVLKYDNFTYNGKKYSYNMGDDGSRVVFADDKYNTDNINDAYKKIKYIDSKAAKSNELKIKTIKTGEDELYYMCQRLRITDYLPGVIIFSNPCYYTAYVEIEFDTMKLEELCNRKLASAMSYSTSGFIIDDLIIDLDELEMLITFLSAEARISEKEPRITSVNELANEFVKLKGYYSDIKQCIKSNFRLLLKFYDSFVNKISIDVCESLYKKFISQKVENEVYLKKEYVDKIKSLVTSHGIGSACKYISHVLDHVNVIKNAIDVCIKPLSKIINKESDNLLSSFKSAGQYIYQLTIQNNEISTIRAIRSPTSFLGGLVSGDSTEVAEKAIKGVEMKFEKVENSENAYKQILLDVTSRKYADRPGNITRGLAVMLDDYKVYKDGKLISAGGEIDKNVINFYKNLETSKTIGDNLGDKLNLLGIMAIKHGPEASIKLASDIGLFKDLKGETDTIVKLFESMLTEGKLAKEGMKTGMKTTSLITEMKAKKRESDLKESPVIPEPKISDNDDDDDDDGKSTSAMTLFGDEIPTININNMIDKLPLKKRLDKDVATKTLNAFRRRGIADDILYEYYISEKRLENIPTYKKASKNMNDIRELRLRTYNKYNSYFFPGSAKK